MKSSKTQNKVYGLLVGLLCLPVAGNIDAADKKNLFSSSQSVIPARAIENKPLVKQKTRRFSPAVVPQTKSHVPAKIKRLAPKPAVPRVLIPSRLSPVAKPRPPAAGAASVKRHPRAPPSRISAPVMPPVVRSAAPVRVAPALPVVPARHIPPTAPRILNPRRAQAATKVPRVRLPAVGRGHKGVGNARGGTGFTSGPPNYGRTTRPSRPKHTGTGAPPAPGRGFALSPLTVPKSGMADHSRGTGRRSVTPGNPARSSGFAPAQTGGRSMPAASRGQTPATARRGGMANPPASSSDTPAGTGRPSGARTAGGAHTSGFVPTKDVNGTPMFSTRDGTRIPGKDQSGYPGGINPDGSVSYSDGTRVEHNDDTGETRIIRPDGEVKVQHRGDNGAVTNPDYNPELGVSGGNDPSTPPPPPEYNAGEDSYRYSDGIGVKASHNGQRGRVQGNGDILFSDGTRYSHDTGTGRTTVIHPDGSTDIYENQNDTSSGRLRTRPGVDTTAADDGGTDVYDRTSGVSAHFGGSSPVSGSRGYAKRNEATGTFDYGDGTHLPTTSPDGSVTGKINPDGSIDYSDGTHVEHNTQSGETTITHPDGSTETKHRGDGKAMNDDSSSNSSDNGSGDTNSSSSSSSNSSDKDSNSSDDSSDTDSSDDSASSDNSKDNDSSSDDSASSDDTDTGDDNTGSDEAQTGFEGSRSNDGGPKATTVVDDRVSRMKGETRDPESPDDAEPGNRGSAPGSVSQPGPGGGHRGSPLARPSAAGHQSPIGGVVLPSVKSRTSVGGGDCFKRDGCDNMPTGGFQLDPFDRAPATNPGK